MRPFNTDFNTEKNKVSPNGPTPINLLVFNFDTPVNLSDRDITIDGTVFSGLVKKWGFVDSSAGQSPGRSIIGQIESSDLGLTIINSENPRFSDHATSTDPIEGVTVTMYQWFEGLALDEKEIIFIGVVGGQPRYSELEYDLTVRGIWQKYNRTIGDGTQITEDDYPGAAPNDVGKMQNISYGKCVKVPANCLDGGPVDNLASSVTDVQTTFPLVDASKFPTAGSGKIDDEYISWTGKSTNTLTPVTRSIGSAPAAAHDEGAVLYQYQDYYVYQIANHPVKSIGDVFVDDVRIPSGSGLTLYTGQSGSEWTGYSGQAVARFGKVITTLNAIEILEANGFTTVEASAAVATLNVVEKKISDAVALVKSVDVDQGSHEHGSTTEQVTWTFEQINNYANVGSPEAIIDNNFETGTFKDLTAVNGTVTVGKGYDNAPEGDPISFKVAMAVGSNTNPVTLTFAWGGRSVSTTGNGITVRSASYAVDSATDTWAKIQALTGLATLPYVAGAPVTAIVEVWVEIVYSKISSAATGVVLLKKKGDTMGVNKTTLGERGGNVIRTGDTDLQGNSVSEVEVGAFVTADVHGHLDDGSGTITGTPDLLIERPDHVYEHLLTNYCSFPSASIGGSFATSGTFYNTNSYKFALLISELIRADSLLLKWAVQCRSRFFVSPAGVAQLIVRQLGQASGHSVPKNEIRKGSMSIRRSAEDDIVNTFSVLFNRDLRMTGADAYQGATPFLDATSVSNYDIRELANPSAMYFDAVVISAMVDHVGAYWLSFLKDSRALPTFAVFLDNMEIEPGDIIDVTHPLDNMVNFIVEVLKIRNVLGSARSNVLDRVEIVSVEN